MQSLGTTPISGVELELGSYLLELVTGDQRIIRYPIRVMREQGWSSSPNSDDPYELPIPGADELGPDDIFVPAGWCLLGGDPATNSGAPAREWVDGFAVRRNAVTYREFADFLASPHGKPHRAGALRDGLEVWRPDWPVVGVSHDAAVAYATWYAGQTGQSWRLPIEEEWEKAARGVDGRFYPWGDFGDVAFAHVRDGGRLPSGPVSAVEPSPDLSPYLVHGMGGNALCWCADESESGHPPVRGGSWMLPMSDARVTSRAKRPGERGYPDVGIRLFRTL
jgi:serine/threonine-protein kinase